MLSKNLEQGWWFGGKMLEKKLPTKKEITILMEISLVHQYPNTR